MPDIVQTWLSNNEPRRDLIAHPSTLNNMKTKFIINLTYYLNSFFPISEAQKSAAQKSAARNATSQYAFICLPFPSPDEYEAIEFLSGEKDKQSEYSMHWNNLEQYLRIVD